MRVSLFNAVVTSVAFSAQRPAVKAVRFGEKTQVQIAQEQIDEEQRVAQEKELMTKHLQQQLDAAAQRQQEEGLKSAGDPDDED